MGYTYDNVEFKSFDNNFFPFGKKLGNSAYVNETVNTLNEVEEDNDGKLPTTFNAIEIDWNTATIDKNGKNISIKTTPELLSLLEKMLQSYKKKEESNNKWSLYLGYFQPDENNPNEGTLIL